MADTLTGLSATAERANVGMRAPRRDALAKVTGAATYTPDLYIPGMLIAKVLRSPHPHARIRSIDTSKAEALPGVHAVLTYENTIDTPYNHSAAQIEANYGGPIVADQRIFDSVVRFVGDEVAGVAAESAEIAEKALGLIEVDYEVLPFYLDPEEAEKPGTVAIHADKPHLQSAHNVSGWPVDIAKGDVDQGFAEADEIVEVTFDIPPVKQMQFETHSAVAQVVEGNLIVQSSTQNVQLIRGHLAHIFKLPMSRVQVSNAPYVGGAFGIRIGLSGKAEVIASALALATKKKSKDSQRHAAVHAAHHCRHPAARGVHGRGGLSQRPVRSEGARRDAEHLLSGCGHQRRLQRARPAGQGGRHRQDPAHTRAGAGTGQGSRPVACARFTLEVIRSAAWPPTGSGASQTCSTREGQECHSFGNWQ